MVNYNTKSVVGDFEIVVCDRFVTINDNEWNGDTVSIKLSDWQVVSDAINKAILKSVENRKD